MAHLNRPTGWSREDPDTESRAAPRAYTFIMVLDSVFIISSQKDFGLSYKDVLVRYA